MPGNSALNVLRLACAALALACTAPALAQQQVVIVTSFPKELTAAYKKAFEAKNPGIKVEILNNCRLCSQSRTSRWTRGGVVDGDGTAPHSAHRGFWS